MQLSDLHGADRERLERLYAEQRDLPVPRGRFVGQRLCWLAGARLHPVYRPLDSVLFGLIPFGVDFDAHAWFFWHQALTLGRFAPRPGPSRWRQTETIRLEYHVSSLPRSIRSRLYDEIKPLTPDLCLGIGGIAAPAGRGDHFFFALTRGGGAAAGAA